MITIDTETTGFDLYHSCRPYLVTICYEDGTQDYWEWPVDPLTRAVNPPAADLRAIERAVAEADLVVGHNIKFDVTALHSVGCCLDWPWGKTEDTTYSGHLLASNRPKNLTDLTVAWAGIDIQKYEDALEVVVKECRRHVQQARGRIKKAKDKGKQPLTRDVRVAAWKITADDDPDTPSADGEKSWKADGWLPLAFYRRGLAKDKPHYKDVLSAYANADSAATSILYRVMMKEVARRKLGAVYKEKVKLIRIGYDLECRGVSLIGENLNELKNRYRVESNEYGAVCTTIAKEEGYSLELPKGSLNGSLRTFMQDVLRLPPVYDPKAKTDAPTFNKQAMELYLNTLPPRSPQLAFVRNLLDKRSRDTALAYMAGYERFRLPNRTHPGYYTLHPNLNVTGSATLRWTCSNPNEQNISKKEAECKECRGEGCPECDGTGKSFRSVRYCFGPAPGREWWSLDAKNIELRLPFYESGEQELIDLFERPDEPPYYGSTHLLNFHTVYTDLWDGAVKEVGFEKAGPYCKKKYDSTWYKWCKNGGFCKQYGGQRERTDATFKRKGAFDLIDSRFSRLTELTAACIRFANRYGYVETIPDRSIDPDRGYPLLVTRTDRGNVLETVPLSYRVQGSAMWWTGKAMARCYGQLEEWNRTAKPGRDYFITMQVHDEMVFDFPKAAHPVKNPKASNLGRINALRRLMEEGGRDYGIPTPVGVEYHESNWGEGVTIC